MALRLTTTSLADDDLNIATDSLQAGEDTAALIAASARRAVTSGDIDAYSSLFKKAEAIGHPVSRYRALKMLSEIGLGMLPKIDPRHGVKVLLAQAAGTLAALEQNPAQPLLLNYAGVALYELWALDGAQALFAAAARLDPELPNVTRNLDAVATRRRARKRAGTKPHAMVIGLAKSALEVAARAQPASGQRISLCMIVRDEEAMLERTLAAVAPAVDEIIVADTGSHDRTVEIAKSFGATVLEHQWTGDFSAARNASFDAASGDWILYLDADEVLDEGQAPALKALAGQTWREAIFIEELNFTGVEDVGAEIVFSTLRLFRNRPEYRFHGRLHEQIASTLPAGLPECIGRSAVQITHYGYLGAVRADKDKSRRNLELLELQRKDGDDSPFLHFNLGAEYFALDRNEEALREFAVSWQQSLAKGFDRYEFTSSLAAKRIRAMRAAAHYQEAIEFGDEALARFPEFTDLVLEQALSLRALDRDEEAAQRLEAAIELGDAPSRYTAHRGAGTYLPRMILASIHAKAGDYRTALELQRWCLEHHSDKNDIASQFAATLFDSGADGEAIVAEIERLAPTLTPRSRFGLAIKLLELRLTAAGTQQLRLALTAQPHSGVVRAAYVEALLYQHEWAQAASVAAEIDELDPHAATMARSEIYAQVVAGDEVDARRALKRAARTGMPAAEQQMYELWLALIAGEEPANALPTAALAPLETILQALLSAHEFKLFECAQKLYMSSTMPLRERRERLAQIYLRCGFLRSAAREWLTVCETAPDLRALSGLTQVSMANGQPQTAIEFARQALALDPGNRAATAALEAARKALAAQSAAAETGTVRSPVAA